MVGDGTIVGRQSISVGATACSEVVGGEGRREHGERKKEKKWEKRRRKKKRRKREKGKNREVQLGWEDMGFEEKKKKRKGKI